MSEHNCDGWDSCPNPAHRTPTLADFLLARIAEDEAVAGSAAGGPWTWHEYRRKDDDGVPYLTGMGGDPETYTYAVEVIEPDHSGECGCRSACRLELRVRHEDREHIARHHPARVLAECEAKRRIVEWHKSWPMLVESPPTFERAGGDADSVTFRASRQMAWLTEKEYRDRFGSEPPTGPVLRYLALPYADHPDYREEWLP